ncbi:glycosyltransferase [Robertkochia marina]|uniref:Glycosyltransferase n=1 Tax=Robertkochia marina TaxID=1227945 RepID=A0A4S3M1C1_9FLAO|nr:glycosyltransferase [Robertkochia marina]THD67978.1 glycosyltransferase [Robertkochia marina]TRZ41525.1 glycosyltransferase [Robertkochia marina]
MRKIFIIGYVWPEPTASAAGIRMLQLIRFFREQDFEVHFGSPAQQGEHGFDLKRMGVHCHDIRVNDDDFDVLIAGIDPEVVMFDRYMMEEQFSWRVAENCPLAIRILNTEDLHFLRAYRKTLAKQHKDFDLNTLKDQSLTKREIAAIYRSDMSLIISEHEKQLLEDDFEVPASILVYHPLFIEDSLKDRRSKLLSFEDRKDMVIVGNFLHAPNADAVEVLRSGLWARIRERLPEVTLHVYGAYMPDHLKSNALKKQGMIFHGRAEDVDTVMRKARLLIAPLRFGAGLKGKLIRAMENGLPSVTTPTGAEGIAGKADWPGEIARSELEFIEAVATLYQTASAWNQAVHKGFDIIDRKFDRKGFEIKLMGRINALALDLLSHRAQNFTGMMLLDQRCMASRYLSKYIMAKNKN